MKTNKPKSPFFPFPVRTLNMKPSFHFQLANHQPLVFMLPKSCSSVYDIICLYSYSHALLSVEGKKSCKIYENHPVLNLFSGPLSVTILWWCHDEVIYYLGKKLSLTFAEFFSKHSLAFPKHPNLPRFSCLPTLLCLKHIACSLQLFFFFRVFFQFSLISLVQNVPVS